MVRRPCRGRRRLDARAAYSPPGSRMEVCAMPSAHSRRKRLGCILAVVGLIAVVVAACSKHDSPTGPNTALIQGQKPLSNPLGRPPGKPPTHGPFGTPPLGPPFTPPGPPPWHDAELQAPADTAVALETGSGLK